MTLVVGAAVNTFGLDGPPEARGVLRAAQRIEELGYESVWVGDHLLFHVPLYEGLTIMAAIAAATERVRVGSGVLLGLLRHPAWLAKSLATIDHVSGGRLIVGLGVGGEFPAEFEAAGIPVRGRDARTDELVDALRHAWSGSAEGFAGRFHQLPEQPLLPVPVQERVPVWVGGRSDAALRRAALAGDGWLGAFVSPRRYAERLEQLRAQADAAGRAAGEIVPAFHTYVRVGRTREEAWREAGPFLGAVYGLDPQAVERYCMCGTVEEVAAQLAPYAEAGVEHVVLRVAGEGELEQLEQLADALVPAAGPVG
jgi:probable F420-dependent oxidoreductase